MAANPEAAAPVELPHPLNCNLATLVDGSSTQQRWRDTLRSDELPAFTASRLPFHTLVPLLLGLNCLQEKGRVDNGKR